MSFQGKTAIVTGGSRGIGRGIVIELARQGCQVAFTYVSNAEAAQQVVNECEAFGVQVKAYQVDAANFEAAQSFVKDVKAQFGSVHFLINNAGITRDKLILMMKEDDWDAVIDTNLKSVFNLSKAVAALLVRQKQGGSILNISSISGVIGMPGQTNYSASKAGMIGFTKALAKELASREITVNALALGMIETDMTGALDTTYREKVTEQIPLKRFGTVAEVARATAFLLSDDGRYITGQVIQIDGGLAM